MNRLLLTTALVAGTLLSVPAEASTRLPLYLSLGAGVTSTRDSSWDDDVGDSGKIGIDNAANFSAAVGTSVTPNIRTEFEVSYRNADLSDISLDGVGSASADGSVKTWAFLVNGYYDFMAGQKFSPYLSAGVGAAHHKGELTAVGGLGTPGADGSDTVFAYQVGAGASYAVTPRTSLWGGYRYLGSSDADFDGVNAEYHANEFRGGVRFNF